MEWWRIVRSLSAALLVACHGAPRRGPPNVLVVLLDDIGTDKVGTYGEHPRAPATPTLDALAANGVLFRNAYAHPSCSPSRAALLTGRYAVRTGVGGNIQSRRGAELSVDEVTLPEMLRHARHPWSSAVIGKWHLAEPSVRDIETHALRAGFDRHVGTIGNLNHVLKTDAAGTWWSWERIRDGRLEHVEDYATTVTMADAREAMDTLPEPFFLYLAVHAAHDPFHVPPAHLLPHAPPPDPDDGARYDLAVQSIDTALGRLLDQMDPALRDRTLVVVMGDNGTPRQVMDPPSKEGKLTVYESGIHVPLIVSGPPVADPGRESVALVSIEDVFPTVAELAGVDLATLSRGDGRPLVIDGISFMPVLRDRAAPSPRELLFQERFYPAGPPPYDRVLRTVRDARFKYIETLTPSGFSATLHDLAGRVDDGPDLLEAPLGDEAAAAMQVLHAELRRVEALPLDGAWR